MVISEKYEILDMIEDGRVQTFRARHRTLGHSLMVHFVKGGNEENFELLEQLARLPEMKRQLFTDAGAQGTVPYLVSWPLPDFDNLNAWLHRCMPSPNAGPMTPKDLPKNRGAGTGPDEFTRIFL